MDKKKEISVGGQAVIEGVMMRGPDKLATAIRRKDGTIELFQQNFESKAKKGTFLGLPLIRGFVSLIEMMVIGMKTITLSANRAELDIKAEEEALHLIAQKADGALRLGSSNLPLGVQLDSSNPHGFNNRP